MVTGGMICSGVLSTAGTSSLPITDQSGGEEADNAIDLKVCLSYKALLPHGAEASPPDLFFLSFGYFLQDQGRFLVTFHALQRRCHCLQNAFQLPRPRLFNCWTARPSASFRKLIHGHLHLTQSDIF